MHWFRAVLSGEHKTADSFPGLLCPELPKQGSDHRVNVDGSGLAILWGVQVYAFFRRVTEVSSYGEAVILEVDIFPTEGAALTTTHSCIYQEVNVHPPFQGFFFQAFHDVP